MSAMNGSTMNCDEIALLIPWYLNHTLEETERAAVASHLEDCPSCHIEVDHATAVARLVVTHPTAGDLADLVAGTLRADEAGVLSDHVDHCDACRTEVDLLEASWTTFDRPDRAGVVAMPRHRLRRHWLGIAASVLLLLTSAGWLREWLVAGGTPAPSANIAVVEAFPTTARERGGEVENTLEVGADTSGATVILMSDLPEEKTPWAVDIATTDGRVVWRHEGLERSPDGDFTLSIPAALLSQPQLEITLYRVVGGHWRKAESYVVTTTR